jgi:hypothetical protein
VVFSVLMWLAGHNTYTEQILAPPLRSFILPSTGSRSKQYIERHDHLHLDNASGMHNATDGWRPRGLQLMC